MNETAILRLSPANFITVGLLASAAYFGVMGAKYAITKLSQQKAPANG